MKTYTADEHGIAAGHDPYEVLCETVVCASGSRSAHPIGKRWRLIETSGDHGLCDAIVCEGCAIERENDDEELVPGVNCPIEEGLDRNGQP